MNPILQSALSSILRYGLMILATFLVKNGVWTQNEAVQYVQAGIVAILALGWSWWQISSTRKKLMTALTMPPGTTENDVKAVIKSGAPTPTIFTPPNTVPGVPAPNPQTPKP